MGVSTMTSTSASSSTTLTFDDYPGLVPTSKAMSRGKRSHTKANKKHDQLVVKANKVLNDPAHYSPSARPKNLPSIPASPAETPAVPCFPVYTHPWEQEAAEYSEQLSARLLELAEWRKERSERLAAMAAKKVLAQKIQCKLLIKDCNREWKEEMTKKTQKKGRKTRAEFAYF